LDQEKAPPLAGKLRGQESRTNPCRSRWVWPEHHHGWTAIVYCSRWRCRLARSWSAGSGPSLSAADQGRVIGWD